MSGVFRDDGKFTVFQIEFKTTELGDEWSIASDHHKVNIPQKMRFKNPSTAEATPLFTRYNDFWQKTYVHGWPSFSDVMRALALYAWYNPGCKFRAVKRTYSQTTAVVGEAAL